MRLFQSQRVGWSLSRKSQWMTGCIALSGLLLSGCGGSLDVSYTVGVDAGYSDAPPTAQISVSTSYAAPGSVVTLYVRAYDDYGVRRVEFSLLDSVGEQPIAKVIGQPWQLTTTVPVNASGRVTYVARAVDDSGQYSAPSYVTVNVAQY